MSVSVYTVILLNARTQTTSITGAADAPNTFKACLIQASTSARARRHARGRKLRRLLAGWKNQLLVPSQLPDILSL
jgi:hypothetical protein